MIDRQPDDPGVDAAVDSSADDASPWKAIAGVFAIAFAVLLIVATTFWGDPDNSLHTSAQSWGFTLVLAVLGGVLANAAILQLLPWGRRP